MLDFMQSVFGIYHGYVVAEDGVVTTYFDFQYIGAVAIFCIVLWGVFSVIRSIFRRK